jgi:multidrug efflux pump subunit AcrB
MNRIVRIALDRPYTVIVMSILILIAGIMAILRSPVDIFPPVKVPVVSAVFSYNGLSPDEMSGRIVTYYERALTTSVSNVEHIESQSIPGYGVVKIYFQPSVDINAALAEVAATSQTVLKQMPPGITPPPSSASMPPACRCCNWPSPARHCPTRRSTIRPPALSGPSWPRWRVPRSRCPMAARCARSRRTSTRRRSSNMGFRPMMSAALAAQNLITPVGTQKIGKLEYTLKLNDSPDVIAAFNDLPIRTAKGAVIYMRDVAFVHDGNPPQTNVVHVDGGNAVLLSIIKSGANSTLSVISGVKDLLPQIRNTLPDGIKLLATGDQSVFVTDAVSSVVREGVIAAGLTGVMILLFLGSWRSTLIITVSIPLSILAAMAALAGFGQTINVMTLGGLALAVGILVDDATVTIENINAISNAAPVREAVIRGTEEVTQPAFVALLCICIAFAPMLLLKGVPGSLFLPLAEAVVLR